MKLLLVLLTILCFVLIAKIRLIEEDLAYVKAIFNEYFETHHFEIHENLNETETDDSAE